LWERAEGKRCREGAIGGRKRHEAVGIDRLELHLE
jgi:hypothetical protein